jgi:hypothetical protein
MPNIFGFVSKDSGPARLAFNSMKFFTYIDKNRKYHKYPVNTLTSWL